jgi:hypothetical protein
MTKQDAYNEDRRFGWVLKCLFQKQLIEVINISMLDISHN